LLGTFFLINRRKNWSSCQVVGTVKFFYWGSKENKPKTVVLHFEVAFVLFFLFEIDKSIRTL
jgi:hypothetical protein